MDFGLSMRNAKAFIPNVFKARHTRFGNFNFSRGTPGNVRRNSLLLNCLVLSYACGTYSCTGTLIVPVL